MLWGIRARAIDLVSCLVDVVEEGAGIVWVLRQLFCNRGGKESHVRGRKLVR